MIDQTAEKKGISLKIQQSGTIDIQDLTDKYIKNIDNVAEAKEKEIMEI